MRGKKSEARKALIRMLRDRDVGLLTAPTSRTLNDYIDHWLQAAAKPRVQARSCEEYERQIVRYIRERLGAVKLDALGPDAIQVL